MRSGERLSAQLSDMGGVGFNVVVNGEERQIPVSDVAAIEFAGAADPPPADVARQAADGRHTVWLRNGDVIEGQLYDIDGVRPLLITVKTEDGEIRLSSSDVRRIVLRVRRLHRLGRSATSRAAPKARVSTFPAAPAGFRRGSFVRRVRCDFLEHRSGPAECSRRGRGGAVRRPLAAQVARCAAAGRQLGHVDREGRRRRGLPDRRFGRRDHARERASCSSASTTAASPTTPAVSASRSSGRRAADRRVSPSPKARRHTTSPCVAVPRAYGRRAAASV